MDLSLIADALHEIAVDLKKHTNVKQEMNVEEDDGSPMYPATQEEFEEEILKEEE